MNRSRIAVGIAAPLLFLLGVLAARGGGALFDWDRLGGPHPSDARLARVFHANEPDFLRLLAMAQEDAKLTRIAPDFTWLADDVGWPRPPSRVGFSDARWNEYRVLFRKLGVDSGVARRPDGVLLFIASTQGLVTGGSSKGYAYSDRLLGPLYESLDAHPTDLPSNVPGFKPIGAGWYIYYDWDD